jgi:hypothetical protein
MKLNRYKNGTAKPVRYRFSYFHPTPNQSILMKYKYYGAVPGETTWPNFWVAQQKKSPGAFFFLFVRLHYHK